MKVPVVLIAGFLGSGKTTLIRHVLANTTRQIAVIVNEFGDLGVDTKTVQGQSIAVREILEGCICCSLEGELDAAFEEVVSMYQPDAIVVETTGIAEPDNVIVSIGADNPVVRLDCVVCIVDADVQCRFPALSGTLLRQVRHADVIVVNKADLVSHLQRDVVVEQVRAVNSSALCVVTNHSKVDVEVLLSVQVSRDLPELSQHVSGMLVSRVKVPVVGLKRVKEWIARVSSPDKVFRVKGRIKTDEGSFLVDAVGGRVHFEPSTDADNVLVCIGVDVDVTFV